MGIQASRAFEDYAVFMRSMHTALASMEKDDDCLYIYSAGPSALNSMAIGFANITERTLKQMGVKIQIRKVPASWFREYMKDVDLFAYFCKKGEAGSDLVDLANEHGKHPYLYSFA